MFLFSLFVESFSPSWRHFSPGECSLLPPPSAAAARVNNPSFLLFFDSVTPPPKESGAKGHTHTQQGAVKRGGRREGGRGGSSQGRMDGSVEGWAGGQDSLTFLFLCGGKGVSYPEKREGE